MDDTTLMALVRTLLPMTTMQAVARTTGIHRNTLLELLKGQHGMNSRTRAALWAWVRTAQVVRTFEAGTSVKRTAQQHGYAIAEVETMLREWLR